ncbi:carbohydrate ABC transporter permease [Streptomyces acidiscabies]|uniref:Carbohydrate ABC transporter permease n=1 Tax=Streptomyces acidiscabies TaxID=42234 RepID=A0AAP6BIC0_9ACTN|nr:carbohydrate ABC transporter permease [Streptomyces acidiscabies]MDX2965291.1 carbohydrate ABC transporter permease [Streptomyces acidiscabies]MDX3022093.1 carbohydrate ABC transporter permease [Streptomyces acidiscabies]MDX3793657.1 carbohydrate ABC transporter permease [Streptomyces acidiscabies]GAV37644.1 L-arabinose transport system permease protein [Streptomyces acidiscabies]
MTTIAAPRNAELTDERTRAHRRSLARPLLYAALVLCALLTLLPFVWVLSGSLRSLDEIRSDPGAWLPHHATLDNFVRLFRTQGFGRFLANSVVVAAIVVAGNIVAASAAGYALAKLDFAGKRIAFGAVMAAMMVPFTTVFVTQFVITVDLGLADTLTGIALPGAALPLSVFIMRQYALSVPDELLEAARIDGAGELRIFFRIFLPLAGPAVATITIMSFLTSWNNFIWPLVVAQSTSTYTLPVGLAATSQAAAHVTDYGLMLAGAIVVMLPVLVLFLFLQRYFVQGVAGSGMR